MSIILAGVALFLAGPTCGTLTNFPFFLLTLIFTPLQFFFTNFAIQNWTKSLVLRDEVLAQDGITSLISMTYTLMNPM